MKGRRVTDASAPSRPRIVFLLSPPYGGATLLDVLLNNHSQVSAPGECAFPPRSVDIVCACGARVSACDFWQAVTARLDPARGASLQQLLPALPWPLARWQFEWGRVALSRNARVNRGVGRVAGQFADAAAPAAWAVRSRSVEAFVARYVALYRVISEMQGTSVFVDGFKTSRRAALLARALRPTHEVSILHLTRDPRGFAASRRRHDSADADVRESAWLWGHIHRRIESLRNVAPYRLLRYEDLASRAEATTADLFRYLGLEPEQVVTAPRYPAKHHIVGNAMVRRFAGNVSLDTRWQCELTRAEQRAVLAAAGPFAAAMGYRGDPAPAPATNALVA
jgi:hypothetical protein